jgi:hypothetical protein
MAPRRFAALALEQPQAAADHGEKVVDVVDDELRDVRYRPHPFPLPPASGDPAMRGGPRAVAQDPRDLAVGPDDQDLHAPRRDEAATAIADATHPALNARCAPSATPALSTSATASSNGGLSTEAGNERPDLSLICMWTSRPTIVQRDADFGP